MTNQPPLIRTPEAALTILRLATDNLLTTANSKNPTSEEIDRVIDFNKAINNFAFAKGNEEATLKLASEIAKIYEPKPTENGKE